MKSLRTLALVAILSVTASSQAAITYFTATWSGDNYGNEASAVGTIGLDLSQIGGPGNYEGTPGPGFAIDSVSITVSGSSVPDFNGTFETSDFYLSFLTFDTSLDFGTDLVGQAQSDGTTWGQFAYIETQQFPHDFNVFTANPYAPNGMWYYTIGAGSGEGELMNLVSFAPTNAVPEPASMAALGLGGLALLRRRRKA